MPETLFLKRTLGTLWRPIPSASSRKVILLFHAVGDGEWAIPRDLFARQMEWIAAEARPISLVQALGTENETKLEVAITFDDGYASVFENARPILRSLGMTASVFVNTGFMGQGERVASDPTAGHYPGESFLLWRELDALLELGWVLGSHGEHHLAHTREPDSVVRRELLASKKSLEEITPGACHYFAYTWGRSTARLRRLVAEAGYTWGLAATHEPVRSTSSRYAIPRINIDHVCSFDDFKAILRGDWDYLRFVQAWRSPSS